MLINKIFLKKETKFMKIDWKRKLTSRKFWLAIASFVTMFIIYFTGDPEKAEKISALIMAGATVIAYIIGEGLADSKQPSEFYITDDYEIVEEDKKEKE
jgi:amino acid transporter